MHDETAQPNATYAGTMPCVAQRQRYGARRRGQCVRLRRVRPSGGQLGQARRAGACKTEGGEHHVSTLNGIAVVAMLRMIG